MPVDSLTYFRIRLTSIPSNSRGHAYVTDPRKQWDGAWYTRRLHEVKRFDDEAKAMAWLALRPLVEGVVEVHTISVIRSLDKC
jgi:hypothetical protein